MGHMRLQAGPNTPPWRRLIALIASGDDVAAVASATMATAQKGMLLAGKDPGLIHAFWLLTKMTQAAKTDDFAAALSRLGIDSPPSPSVFDLVGGYADAMDGYFRQKRNRTDIGEMAQLAAVETLSATLAIKQTTLFGHSEASVQQSLRDCTSPSGFRSFAHEYFARFVDRLLKYHLSRVSSQQVGTGMRFESTGRHEEFRDSLRVHSHQAAHIVKEFAGGWYGKRTFETGITEKDAGGFVYVATEKLYKELVRRGAGDAG